jgi:hypothetical protein
MYAQFQSYQSAGTAASTQQPGLIWNGSGWVSASAPAQRGPVNTFPPQSFIPGSNEVSCFQQPVHPQAPTPSPDAVQIYTSYYHEWTKRAEEQQQVVERSSNPTDRAHAQGHYDWFKYYADQASRAAHWFFSNPSKPAPFDLPPAPPPLATAPPQAPPASVPSVAPQQQQIHPQFSLHQQQRSIPGPPPPASNQSASSNQSSSASQAPDGLKRYVDRCLSQCTSPDEKQGVMARIEEKMKIAIMNGSFHSKDWDSEPLVLLRLPVSTGSDPVSALSSQAPSSKFDRHGHYGPSSRTYAGLSAQAPSGMRGVEITSGPNTSHFGPISVKVKSQCAKSVKKRKSISLEGTDSLSTSSSVSDSYYGPSLSFKQTNRSSPKQQQKGSDVGYYGPASTIVEDEISVPAATSKHRKMDRKGSGFNQSKSSLASRSKRFAGFSLGQSKSESDYDRYMGKGTIGGSTIQLDEEDYENMKVKGMCLTLEKEYLRLTAPPRAELVRPQPILEQHLRNLKAERQLAPSDRRDYLWFCSQLKAVRQDCTVQHIQNSFAVEVYETHARIALEEGDLNEYNQCQTQLKDLYRTLEDGDPKATANRNEFIAYRLLYYIFLTGNNKYDGGSSDLFKIMTNLTLTERTHPAINHALQVRVAVADCDYHKFFLLRKRCPNLGSHLMDLIVPGLRYNTILRMCKAYRPCVEVPFVLSQLGFDPSLDMDYGISWLESCGCILSADKLMWNTKDTVVRESDTSKKKSLI